MDTERIGVLGLGTIGLKLVEYLVEKDFPIVAYNWRNADEKKRLLQASIEKKIRFEKLSYEMSETFASKISFTESLADLAPCTLVIDSLREDYGVKGETFGRLLDIVPADSIVATTTSSLSLEKLSAFFPADRLFGLHFFNPPTKMKLVELAFLQKVPESTRNRVYRFLGGLGDKKVIEIPPIQGYIVNRILFVYINYAIEYVSTTGIEARYVDDAMKFGTNVPMGPLELSDYIGNDVTLDILRELYESLGDSRYEPNDLLRNMVASGRLGRKVKSGFYQY